MGIFDVLFAAFFESFFGPDSFSDDWPPRPEFIIVKMSSREREAIWDLSEIGIYYVGKGR